MTPTTHRLCGGDSSLLLGTIGLPWLYGVDSYGATWRIGAEHTGGTDSFHALFLMPGVSGLHMLADDMHTLDLGVTQCFLGRVMYMM